MFEDMEEKQKMMQAKLAEIKLEASAGDGAIKVVANAKRELLNITIAPSVVDATDVEQLEDLLLVAINRVMTLASEKEVEMTQQMIQDFLPPGMGDLTDLFG
ncbi:MAG: YbaB/EbfC family nucleoid-associated protein [Bacteroidota bacterium]